MQAKNFDTWNHEKKDIDALPYERFHFHEREIWWASLGLNVGDEQDGKNELFERPVLILKKFNNKVVVVVPLTSHLKEGKFYKTIKYGAKTSTVILSQVRLLSVKRFRRFVRKISYDQFAAVQEKLQNLLFG